MTLEQKRTFRDWLKIASPILSAIAICLTVSIKVGEGIVVITRQSAAINTLNQKAIESQEVLKLLVPKVTQNEADLRDLDKRVSRIEGNIDRSNH